MSLVTVSTKGMPLAFRDSVSLHKDVRLMEGERGLGEERRRGRRREVVQH